MKNSWFRLYSEFATDPKIQSLSETLQRRFIMLLCLKSNDELEKLDEDELAFSLRITPEELQQTKKVFIKKGFVDENWNILNWDKRQFVSDKSTERVRAYRLKNKDLKESNANRQSSDLLNETVCNDNETLQKRKCNVTVTPPDTDTDTDTDTDILLNVSNETLSVDKVDLSTHEEPIEEIKIKKPEIPNCPHEKIIDLYHQILPMCPKVLTWNAERQKYLRARWKEYPELHLWEQYFHIVAESKFLTGKVNASPNRKVFLATLEWLVRPTNFANVLEKKYHER